MNFTTHIPHQNQLLDVYFSKMASTSVRYFIEVHSGEATIASFEMQKDHYNKWKVTDPVPQWIVDYELHLAQVIANNQFHALNEF